MSSEDRLPHLPDAVSDIMANDGCAPRTVCQGLEGLAFDFKWLFHACDPVGGASGKKHPGLFQPLGQRVDLLPGVVHRT